MIIICGIPGNITKPSNDASNEIIPLYIYTLSIHYDVSVVHKMSSLLLKFIIRRTIFRCTINLIIEQRMKTSIIQIQNSRLDMNDTICPKYTLKKFIWSFNSITNGTRYIHVKCKSSFTLQSKVFYSA